jgi:hypothetical protein
MAPEAIVLIEEELVRRGVSAEDVLAHAEHLKREAIFLPDGTTARCARCERPAVARIWAWQRWWGWLPIFPRWFYYCAEHRPEASH